MLKDQRHPLFLARFPEFSLPLHQPPRQNLHHLHTAQTAKCFQVQAYCVFYGVARIVVAAIAVPFEKAGQFPAVRSHDSSRA